ncbi:MAG: hypothetical protein EBY15_10730, partial [Gammaproteobacteria bacterium]|nr:hypothetical protein [Gammaproteobacteria bacterium]
VLWSIPWLIRSYLYYDKERPMPTGMQKRKSAKQLNCQKRNVPLESQVKQRLPRLTVNMEKKPSLKKYETNSSWSLFPLTI